MQHSGGRLIGYRLIECRLVGFCELAHVSPLMGEPREEKPMHPSDAYSGAASSVTSDAVWRKSVRSGSNYGCVETARLSAEHIGVRDSKDVRDGKDVRD